MTARFFSLRHQHRKRFPDSTIPRLFGLSFLSQALPLMAMEMGVSAQELSLEDVVPTSSSSGMLDDGKLDLVMVTVPETATVEVCKYRQTASRWSLLFLYSGACRCRSCCFFEGLSSAYISCSTINRGGTKENKADLETRLHAEPATSCRVPRSPCLALVEPR